VELRERIQRLHDAAEAAGEPYYNDPLSGFLVMTRAYLGELGVCCDRGCRHCPYGCADEELGSDRDPEDAAGRAQSEGRGTGSLGPGSWGPGRGQLDRPESA
jgi:hypothetical protein